MIYVKERANVFCERLKRDDIYVNQANIMKKNAEASIISNISKKWTTDNGYQKTNNVIILVFRSFKA